jgi:hypothetical protein
MTRNALAATALAALTGCVSHLSITPAELAPRTELRVRFDSPHSMPIGAPGGDTLVVTDVVEMEGRIIAISDDSVRIAVGSAKRSSNERQRFGGGSTTMFALADARVDRIQRNNGRTATLVISLVLGAALLIAVATYEDPPPPPPPAPKTK